MSKPLTASWQDVWLLDGVRTPFVDYNGGLAQISPIDLGIKAAREVFARSGASPDDVGTVITGNMAQASFDAYLLPRHIGLYSGVPIETPAHMVQRVCGTGIEVLMQAADTITHKGVDLALCVGTEFDEPQSDRRLYAPQRLPHGAGGVQGLPLGSPDGPFRQCHDGRHRGEPRAPVPDHARRGGRLCGALVRARREGEGVGLPRRRDRAGEDRGVFARRLQCARHQAVARDQGARPRHAYPPVERRGAGKDPPGLRRRADRRQFLRDRRWRGGRARGVRRLREVERQGAARPARRRRRGRRAAGDHGHRPGAGDPGGGRARRA